MAPDSEFVWRYIFFRKIHIFFETYKAHIALQMNQQFERKNVISQLNRVMIAMIFTTNVIEYRRLFVQT